MWHTPPSRLCQKGAGISHPIRNTTINRKLKLVCSLSRGRSTGFRNKRHTILNKHIPGCMVLRAVNSNSWEDPITAESTDDEWNFSFQDLDDGETAFFAEDAVMTRSTSQLQPEISVHGARSDNPTTEHSNVYYMKSISLAALGTFLLMALLGKAATVLGAASLISQPHGMMSMAMAVVMRMYAAVNICIGVFLLGGCMHIVNSSRPLAVATKMARTLLAARAPRALRHSPWMLLLGMVAVGGSGLGFISCLAPATSYAWLAARYDALTAVTAVSLGVFVGFLTILVEENSALKTSLRRLRVIHWLRMMYQSSLKSQLATAKQTLSHQRRDLHASSGRLASVAAEEHAAQRKLEMAHRELDSVKTANAELTHSLHHLRKDLGTTVRKLATTGQELSCAAQKLEQSREDLIKAQGTNRQLMVTLGEMNTRKAEVETQLQAAHDDFAALKKEYKAMETQNSDLESEMVKMKLAEVQALNAANQKQLALEFPGEDFEDVNRRELTRIKAYLLYKMRNKMESTSEEMKNDWIAAQKDVQGMADAGCTKTDFLLEFCRLSMILANQNDWTPFGDFEGSHIRRSMLGSILEHFNKSATAYCASDAPTSDGDVDGSAPQPSVKRSNQWNYLRRI